MNLPRETNKPFMAQQNLFSVDRSGQTYRWLVIVAGMLAFFTMVISSSTVNVAIPHVMGSFGVGQDKAQYLSTSFLAATVTSLLLNSWFIAKFGQRTAFVSSLLLFCLGSVISGFSPNLGLIIVGRVIQGFAAGIIQPLVMVLLFQFFPPEKRGSAMGMFSMGVVFALGLGPAIGGITIDNLHWRYIFLVPIPTTVMALVLGVLFMPERPRSGEPGPFDILGYSLMCATVFCLMTIIGNGQRLGWFSNDIMALGAVMVAAGAGFVYSQRLPRSNLLDLSLFRNPRFVTAVTISFLFGFVSFATIYIFPVFAQIVQGYTATLAGSLLLPGSLAAAAFLPFSGRLADHFPPTALILAGMIIFIYSTILMAGSDIDTVFWSIALYLFIGRMGNALVSPALMSTAMDALPASHLHQGAGTVNLCLMLGGSCGINALVVVLERRIEFHGDAFAMTQTSANPATREMLSSVRNLLGEGGIPDALRDGVALDYLNSIVAAQANTLGFQDGFIAIAFVSAIAAVPVFLLTRKHRRPQ
ncbi:MAG: Multidrug export protein EmrB [Alphaproteobacteria bacterium MarineAlpha10_Bin3]|jgi:EmrB/QacA subfamily drug resistance transporter|nr:MAG: Multidrug export protein EmrB [Alphaproteobacteria bacterium MarineAlpha10_Bin3]PPR70690.1 MAG: Multidrug export protein EmrB [Alphaproteobacteria bacterium MarineAlpha4_Bin1]